MTSDRELTRLELLLDRFANRWLTRVPTGVREFLVFGIKQAWACLFGALMLAAIVATAWWYPDGAALDRNDLLVIIAVLIQIGMLAFRLETGREFLVIVVFHIVGTGMEIFKTAVGSWNYAPGGVLHIGAVPCSRDSCTPPSGPTSSASTASSTSASAITRRGGSPRSSPRHLPQLLHPPLVARHPSRPRRGHGHRLLPRTMHFRVHTRTLRMPILLAFVLVAFFIWIAENIGTAAGAWLYPSQAGGWGSCP